MQTPEPQDIPATPKEATTPKQGKIKKKRHLDDDTDPVTKIRDYIKQEVDSLHEKQKALESKFAQLTQEVQHTKDTGLVVSGAIQSLEILLTKMNTLV